MSAADPRDDFYFYVQIRYTRPAKETKPDAWHTMTSRLVKGRRDMRWDRRISYFYEPVTTPRNKSRKRLIIQGDIEEEGVKTCETTKMRVVCGR
jgi:hypothetical protein